LDAGVRCTLQHGLLGCKLFDDGLDLELVWFSDPLENARFVGLDVVLNDGFVN